jgi:hypothetical protein
MEYTQEEYDEMVSSIEERMNYYADRYSNMDKDEKQQFIKQRVDKHFIEFLNNAEQQAIEELIIANFKENHRYSGTGNLPSGNLLGWEIQIVVSHYNKFICKEHMEEWYTQEYYNQLASIIKSKKL